MSITAKADAFFQVIHVEQVVFPLLVEHAQHNHALVITHGVRADEFLFGLVALLQLIEYCISEFLAVELFCFDSFCENIHAETREDRIFQTFDVPIGSVRLYRNVLLEQFTQNSGDVIFDDQIFLFESLQQTPAQAIDGLTLLVHHIVILEQMFARLEMLSFDCFLRFLDSAADQSRFDWDTFFHAQPLKQGRHPLLRKDAHEVVFQRKIKTRRSGVALTAGATAKLIVNSPGLMAFSAKNKEAASSYDFVMFFVGLRFVAVQSLFPLIVGDGVFVAGVVPNSIFRLVDIGANGSLSGAELLRNSLLHAFLLGHEFGVAAEENVGAAPRHVGGNGHHAFAARLGNNFGFLLVILGVEYDVLDALLLQQVG